MLTPTHSTLKNMNNNNKKVFLSQSGETKRVLILRKINISLKVRIIILKHFN